MTQPQLSNQALFLNLNTAIHPKDIIGEFKDRFHPKDSIELLSMLKTGVNEIPETLPSYTRVQQYLAIFEEPSFIRSCERLFLRQKKQADTNDPSPNTGYSMRDSTLQKRKASCSTAVEDVIDQDNWNVDQIYLRNGDKTVGHIIKKAAIELIPLSGDISSDQRRILTLGLSSILDLTDRSVKGQLKSLFKEEEQNEIMERFKHLKQYDSNTSFVSEELDMHLELMQRSLVKSQLSGARSYILRQILCSTDEMTRDLNVLQHIIETHLFNEHLFTPSSTAKKNQDISELDYLADIWKPLFSRLFAGSAAKIRNKGGETTMIQSNEEKRRIYNDDTAIAFKIDCRILLDHNGKEYDLASIEIAKNTGRSKICFDGAKLLREAKSITNMLAGIVADDDHFLKNTTAFAIQIGGLSGAIYSLHLVAPTLYVAVFEASLQFPATPSSLDKLKPTLNALLWLRNRLNEGGNQVRSTLSRVETIEDVLTQPSGNIESHSRRNWINDVFYTPPSGKKIRLLDGLVKPSVTNLTESFLAAASDNSHSFPNVEFNEDGWGRVYHGGSFRWFNIHLNKFSSTYGGKSPSL
ncbi:hypothetical protein BX616_009371 [Lobosporangium transversale]|uniref:Uncharacterized protein n=1 Tax=Lobosporangium transversale TaxID=64571 RepID=A0A1Y2G8N6_9FUNG|nr:hypothetical protein BCR41DRAFT_425989 [Lobosporangium transversale]KAF9913897.1 hypothetical protein BX616_009371 [Lobosporangium transversale]ORZ04322.1 hypothetical protein BCR41DRAFT_425989 [Lobosporangium transversale]|eukprot:XP_021876480.1 hypothetical protein BCR41DRAFT_425989 [Lobosporangium transversale]